MVFLSERQRGFRAAFVFCRHVEPAGRPVIGDDPSIHEPGTRAGHAQAADDLGAYVNQATFVPPAREMRLPAGHIASVVSDALAIEASAHQNLLHRSLATRKSRVIIDELMPSAPYVDGLVLSLATLAHRQQPLLLTRRAKLTKLSR